MVLLTQFPSSLVIGRRFVPSDVVLNPVDPLPNFATGLQLFGVGELGAYGFTDVLYKQRLPKSYHLTGMFGQASSDGLSTGSVIYRSPWRKWFIFYLVLMLLLCKDKILSIQIESSF